MHPVSLRALSLGYLAEQRLTNTANGVLRIHSAFRQTLNLQLSDGPLLPLISANSSLNHPDAVRVAVAENWDWRTVGESHFRDNVLVSQSWQLSLLGVPVWKAVSRSLRGDVKPHIAILEDALREWCQQQQVDSVLRLLPDDAFGVQVDISPEHNEQQLAEMANQIIGFGGGLTPDGDDYLLGYFAALTLSQLPAITRHQQRLVNVVNPRLTRTNDISRHYLARAIQGHFSEAITLLLAEICEPQHPQKLQARARGVMAFGAASGTDCMAGILHGLRNVSAFAQ